MAKLNAEELKLKLRVRRAQILHGILHEAGPHEFLTTLKVVFDDMARDCSAESVSINCRGLARVSRTGSMLQNGQSKADLKKCETEWWKAMSVDMTHALFNAKMLKELEKSP